MIKLNLKNTFVTNVELKNIPKPHGGPFKIGQKFTYNVKYTSANLCRAELICMIDSEENPDFKIHFTMVGIFEFDPAIPREEIHRQTYLSLYPFARAFGVNLTASCGMPPFHIIQIDIDSQEIFRIDLGGLK